MSARAFAIAGVMTTACISEPGPPACQPPRVLGELATPGDEINPVMTTDRLEIVFGSDQGGHYGLYHATRIAPNEDFGATVVLAPDLYGGAEDVFDPWLTSDGNTLYYVQGSGDSGGTLMRATRAAGFADGVPAFAELGGALLHPTLTADELTIVYAVPSVSTTQIWLADRPTAADMFRDERPLTLGEATVAADASPSISGDGQTLVFDTNRFGAHTALARAQRSGDDFTGVTQIDVNDPTSNDQQPFMHPDGRTLLFASDRPGIGGFDVWIDCE